MDNNEKRKAILYARFSPRKNADTCDSIEAQFDFCRQYCAKNNIEIVAEFSDRALSGGDEDRPGLWQAIDELKRGYLLVVYKLDRLARSVYLSFIIEEKVKKLRASILSISGEGTSSNSDEDFLVRKILQVLAEYQRKVIAARTKAAVLRHQKNGRRMSHILPYGCKADPEDDKRMVLDQDEQKTIAEIVRLAHTGMSNRGIAKELNQSKLFRPRKQLKLFNGKPVSVYGKWHHHTIATILKRYAS